MSAGISKLGIRENLKGLEKRQDSQGSQAGQRSKWELILRKARERSQTPIRPAMLDSLRPLRLIDRSEGLKNPRSAIMKVGQIMVISGQENCAVDSPFLCCL